MWKRIASLLIVILALSFQSSTQAIQMKGSDVLGMLPPGFDICDLVNDDIEIIPCSQFDQMPVQLPPVEVNCGPTNPLDGNKQRCETFL